MRCCPATASRSPPTVPPSTLRCATRSPPRADPGLRDEEERVDPLHRQDVPGGGPGVQRRVVAAARAARQGLTPLNPPAVTARFREIHVTDAAYAGSRRARNDQLLTSSGSKALFGVTPSTVVPTSKWCCWPSHIAATKRRAQAARACHTCARVSLASSVNRTYRSMLCSVDFHSICWPPAVSPPV